MPLVPVSIDGSYRVIFPGTLQVNPGTIIRIKIDRPIDLGRYARTDKQRLMEDVFQVMAKNLNEMHGRRRPEEEREDAVFRWIYGRSGRPDYEALRARTAAR